MTTRAPLARLGSTLPQLFFEARSRYGDYDALHRRLGIGWETTSSDEFFRRSGNIALGMRKFGLNAGDRVAFYMNSDSEFVVVDMGCLISGIVDVPIYLSQAPEAVHYVLEHSGSRILFVSNAELLEEVRPALRNLPALETIVVVDGPAATAEGITVITLRQLERMGAEAGDAAAVRRLADQRYPDDLATIIYTSGTTGTPKGVMLSHENLASNALYTYQETGKYRFGPDGETVLSFLPLSHVFARTMCYASVAFGSPIWFTTPDRLIEDFGNVRPTVFATVPRVLEKVYAKIVERSNEARGVKGKLARWALERAVSHEMGDAPKGMAAVKHRTADKLVYAKWRAVLGGRVSMISAGGAALNGDIVRLFDAAGIDLLQGYGLTETSPVITFNRPATNRPGWVGQPLPHIEVRIAEDGEICTRGPHVMMGYFRDPDKTAEVIDDEGWFHTGDIGEFKDGFLRITDRKKDLFKLSTGKYVMPQPLENVMTTSPLVEQAVVVGAGRKYTTALIFPTEESLRKLVDDTASPLEDLVLNPTVLAAYADLVREANEGRSHWTCIKRFRLVPDTVSIENGLLTPTLKIKRNRVRERFEREIESMYVDGECKPPVVDLPQQTEHGSHAH
ncbi:MAG: long-chain fatty acid--CoA ligase [Rhodothermales bacterium]|nr:long-chain fatty acid--CoA ligase [Rhodothermales bacterium]MBO6780113.1 long-chain fatty acid--CoA ligase [Rhodothermales bacterium]